MLQRPRILVVEDESGIADTIVYALASDGFTPHWCSAAQEALADFGQHPAALVILDVGLPDLNGFELLKALRALPGGDAVPVLFLTARSDEIDRVVGLELGADDYVAKPFSPRELAARVRAILRRTGRAPAAQATAPETAAPVFDVDEERQRIRYYGNPLELSRYEFRLLALLARRPGRVFTRQELLSLVWDESSESLDRTVDAHVKTLRSKLREVAPGLDPIRTLRGTGYALREDLPARP